MLYMGKKAIYILFTLFLALFIVSSFFLRAKYNYFDYGDKPVLATQKVGILALLIVFLLVLAFFMYGLCTKLNKYSKKAVIPAVLVLSFALQLCIIFSFTRLPTDDSQTVLTLAMNMLYKNDYSSFNPPGYLHMFPFNYSTVLYLKGLLSLFPDNYIVIKVFNILFSLITTIMIYFIFRELNGNPKENDYGILVFAAFYPPALLMSNFIYNDTIATAFFTSAIYFAIKFVNRQRLRYVIAAGTLLSIGNYFRSLGLIILIAFTIYFLFNANKTGLIKMLASVLILFIMIGIPGQIQNTALQAKNLINQPVGKNSAPIHMWLNMGLNLENFGFWDDMESYHIYMVKGKYNKELSTQLFKEEIKTKLAGATRGQLLEMYYKKLVWTWTEGTYQVERYGLGLDISNLSPGKKILGGYCYSTSLSHLFEGASPYRRGFIWVLYTVNFLMYCCIFVRMLLSMKRKSFVELLLVLVILGFIAFYLLWEIKSRYIFPVYPLLIILSYMGFKNITRLRKCLPPH